MVANPLLIAQRARERLRSVVTGFRDESKDKAATPLPDTVDIVITPCEVNLLHGTGTLLYRIFADSSAIVSIRTSNFYGKIQTFGAANFCLPTGRLSREEIAGWLKWWLPGTKVRRVICLPYLPMDPELAIVAKETFGVPLCTYVMDDKNVCAEGISDSLMQELFSKSELRLVISAEMGEAYAKKYGMTFWVVPPLVPSSIIAREPRLLQPGVALDRGVLLGNIWGQRWLEMLRHTFRESGFKVDWYCNSKKPEGLVFDAAELEKDGIRHMDPVAEADLPEVLSKYAFAVVPSDTFDGQSPPAVRAIAQFSLPSRIPTMMATSHIPMLVLGHPETCAARIVQRFGLGEVAPYEPGPVRSALQRLTARETQDSIPRHSAELSPAFASDASADWIWRSLAVGHPIDDRYEKMMTGDL